MPSFRWLHLSDLHVGIHEQGWLWPNYGSQILADFERIYDKSGPWDLVLFSGDLVNRGTIEEYNKLDDILDGIWSTFARLGCDPKLVTLPGNHDLARSNSMAPELIALENFWKKPELQVEAVKPGSVYKSFIDERFANYMEWRTRRIESGLHAAPIANGIFPGDSAYEVNSSDASMGIIALNSTWLQLGAANYKGFLCVDPMQLMQITESNPNSWLAKHNFNILATHQPSDWLYPSNLETWESEINPTGRFDLHAFGHMHEPETSRTARGGSTGRRAAQSASLFGLEKLSDGTTQRIQGYAAFQISQLDENATIQCWPRVVTKTSDRDRKLAADISQDLEEDNSFSFSYKKKVSDTASAVASISPVTPDKVLEASTFDVDNIRASAPDIQSHKYVRKVEQRQFSQGINESGAVWLVSDWGMAAQNFIFSNLEAISVSEINVFIIDCSKYVNRENFILQVGTNLGNSFENIFTSISNIGSSLIILDDIPQSNNTSKDHINIPSDFEKMVRIIQDYAPEAKIVLKTRVLPSSTRLPQIRLTALDEPDVALYVRYSELGDARYAKPDAVGTIFRRTDGVPARVEDALRDLQVTSLADLASTNPDFADSALISTDTPPSLIMAINDLRAAQDSESTRAFELLLALSSMPYGEQLTRIRRFLGVHPFTTTHARRLVDRGLANTVTLSGLADNDDHEQVRALFIPRIVREYVIATMDDEKSNDIDRALLTMYFGERWRQGDISNSPAGKRAKNPLSEGYEFSNTSTVILRMLIRAINHDDKLTIEHLLRLSSSLAAALLTGNHYRSVASLTADITPLLDDELHKRELSLFYIQQSRALRMLGKLDDSLESSLKINLKSLSKVERQNALLGRGLIYESKKEEGFAAENAKLCIAANPKSAVALHGQLILAEQIDTQSDRIKRLKEILADGRKKKASVLINNVLISLANEPNTSLKSEQLTEVVETANDSKDFWNVARATITLAEILPSIEDMSIDHKKRLVDAYHFLHAERLPNLFDRCHAVLWKLFEETGDTVNLINLYRHSSFIWRLAGREEIELKYLRKLAANIGMIMNSNLPNIHGDRAYLIVRLSDVLGEELPDDERPKRITKN